MTPPRPGRVPEGEIGSLLQAKVSTEVFVIDGSGTLRYRGAVDDQHGITFSNPVMREDWLRNALDDVLVGRLVRVAETEASGCFLELDERGVPRRDISYHGRISRIVQQNCVSCHREGGVAPFSLETYQDLYGFRAMVKWVIENERMPPWFAHGSVGEWRNDRSLSDRDRRDLLAWIEAGAPEGDPDEAVARLAWVDGWRLAREPDAVIALPEPVDIPAEGVVDYQFAYVKTDFLEDKWIEALEVRPSARQVTHHVLVFLEGPEDEQGGPMIGGTAPGAPALVFPEGTAKRLPKGAWLKFEMHYTTNGTATQDRTEMGLLLADGPPDHEVRTQVLANTEFEIPPHAERHEVVATRGFSEPASLPPSCPTRTCAAWPGAWSSSGLAAVSSWCSTSRAMTSIGSSPTSRCAPFTSSRATASGPSPGTTTAPGTLPIRIPRSPSSGASRRSRR